MDSVHKYLSRKMNSYNGLDTIEDLAKFMYGSAGFDWINDKINDWDYFNNYYPEFEVRSALEFIRPELPSSVLAILDEWDTLYKEWIAKGIFYQRYAEVGGWRFTWENARSDATEMLGRAIPRSHFWYWPPEEKEGNKASSSKVIHKDVEKQLIELLLNTKPFKFTKTRKSQSTTK